MTTQSYEKRETSGCVIFYSIWCISSGFGALLTLYTLFVSQYSIKEIENALLNTLFPVRLLFRIYQVFQSKCETNMQNPELDILEEMYSFTTLSRIWVRKKEAQAE